MTPESLRALIDGGETLDVEFKGEEKRPLSDGDVVDTVVCLANRPGDAAGWLLIGVEDAGRVTGAEPPHPGGTDLLRLQALIAGQTRPALTVRASTVEVDGLDVIAIEVPAARAPVGTSAGRYVRRALGGDGKPACVPMHFHEMQAHQADRGALDYSSLVLPDATWGDLDPLEFERFRRSIRESRGQGDESLLTLSDVELAKALGAVKANHEVSAVKVLGVLLFGREEALQRLLPTHEVAFQVVSDQRVEVNSFIRWPVLRAMDELMSRFRARNREEEIVEGLLRIGVPDYPERAYREAVANALVHRDYTRIGAAHVQWLSDTLEISSPGGFPEGVRLDNLLVTPPRPRNPLLADAFKRAGVVERTGRGIDTIFLEQLRSGRPAPEYGRSNEAAVVLRLPGGVANLGFVRLVAEQSRADRSLGLDELLLLNQLWLQRRLSTTDAAEIIQKPEGEARTRLQRLVEYGLVEARGEGRSRSWHLAAATYRRLGEKSAYVRVRGFEPMQQEQMVLQYARKHGRITRGEAADLCQLEARQAGRLLSRMVKSAQLRRHGLRKAAWYDPVS